MPTIEIIAQHYMDQLATRPNITNLELRQSSTYAMWRISFNIHQRHYTILIGQNTTTPPVSNYGAD